MADEDDCYKKRNTNRLKIPNDISLKFFAYDVFKEGQIAYSRISDYVEKSYDIRVDYSLNNVNGVPFLVRKFNRYYSTYGTLIEFKKKDAYDAYKIISDAKSKKLYGWRTIKYGEERINVLFGRDDIIDFEYAENAYRYDGRKDPMIVDVLLTIADNVLPIISKYSHDNNDFFNLQMNYAMLWSSIDRYLVLKYGKKNQQENLKFLADEESFKQAVLKYADINNKVPSVFSNEDFRSFDLNKQKPLCCIRYYYTIRCNVVHTGKSSYEDYDLLKYSMIELLIIYMYVLKESFNEKNLFKGYFEELEHFIEDKLKIKPLD